MGIDSLKEQAKRAILEKVKEEYGFNGDFESLQNFNNYVNRELKITEELKKTEKIIATDTAKALSEKKKREDEKTGGLLGLSLIHISEPTRPY